MIEVEFFDSITPECISSSFLGNKFRYCRGIASATYFGIESYLHEFLDGVGGKRLWSIDRVIVQPDEIRGQGLGAVLLTRLCEALRPHGDVAVVSPGGYFVNPDRLHQKWIQSCAWTGRSVLARAINLLLDFFIQAATVHLNARQSLEPLPLQRLLRVTYFVAGVVLMGG